MLTFYPSRIPDPGVKKAPDHGFGSATLLLSINDQPVAQIFFLLYLGRIEAELKAGGGVQLRPQAAAHQLQAAHQQACQQAPDHSH
jgi:hypothetical protein